MAARLEITHGLVSESDRLSTSADTLSVTEPSTGSKTRTKGILYLVVSSAVLGQRAREATALVAETIRREYYYDESAGVPICLEKAVRSAGRRLRGSREGGGLPPGAIGIGAVVVRNNELYLATLGDVDAYLVRSARLLMPDRQPSSGLPDDDTLRVDVWRGELAMGDSLALVSRNLTRTVGTDELKNAILTLHPQSAVEHLHHLFVAAGGEGSDAIIALEAREHVARAGRRTPAPRPADAYGDLPPPLPMPAAGAASAIGGAGGSARLAAGRMVDRVMDLMPSRPVTPARMTPRVSRQERQRRVAVGFLAILGAVVVLGLFVWVLPRATEREAVAVSGAESAFLAAQEEADRAAGLVAEEDTAGALAAYRSAWRAVRQAEAAGLPAATAAELAAEIEAGMNGLYGARVGTTRQILAFEPGADPGGLVRGQDRAAYFFDRTTGAFTRVDLEEGAAAQVGTAGTGAWAEVAPLRIIASGGPDIILVDGEGDAWRWRPSNRRGRGTLAPLRTAGDVRWGDDVTDIGTYLRPGQTTGGLYNLYVADPSSNQILRYEPTADGSGFSAPTDYLITDNEGVADFRRLFIDGDIYALTETGLLKHGDGRLQADYSLQVPPDDGDLRPGRDYRLVRGTSSRSSGRVYVHDAAWGRILIFDKATGRYQGQWSTGPDGPSMADVRGMYMVEPTRPKEPIVVYWVSPDGLFETRLREPRPAEPEP
jgi:hypothetical protein